MALGHQCSMDMVLSDTEQCQSYSPAGFPFVALPSNMFSWSSLVVWLLCEVRLICDTAQSPSSSALSRAASFACLKPEIMMEEVKPYTTFHAFSTSGVKASPRSSANVIITAFPKMGQNSSVWLYTMWRPPRLVRSGTSLLESCNPATTQPTALRTLAKSFFRAAEFLRSPSSSLSSAVHSRYL